MYSYPHQAVCTALQASFFFGNRYVCLLSGSKTKNTIQYMSIYNVHLVYLVLYLHLRRCPVPAARLLIGFLPTASCLATAACRPPSHIYVYMYIDIYIYNVYIYIYIYMYHFV